jgi:hypothetical protein
MCLSGFSLSGLVDPMHFFTSNPNAAQAATTPAVAAPIAPPQAAKTPDVNGIQSATSTPGGGVNSGPASTMLTGTGGVDPSALNTGKSGLLGSNTLLGS